MEIRLLKNDDEIKKAYSEANTEIYFREGSEGDYTFASKNDRSLDDFIDATTFGFELVSVTGGMSFGSLSEDTVKEATEEGIER